jgi:carbamate kinase
VNLDHITVAEAKQYLAEGQFPAGSMGPKIQAAAKFVEESGKEVIITTAEALLKGSLDRTGTHIIP